MQISIENLPRTNAAGRSGMRVYSGHQLQNALQDDVAAKRAKIAQLQAMQARNQKDAVMSKQVRRPISADSSSSKPCLQALQT